MLLHGKLPQKHVYVYRSARTAYNLRKRKTPFAKAKGVFTYEAINIQIKKTA
jgi:hypothetical protein